MTTSPPPSFGEAAVLALGLVTVLGFFVIEDGIGMVFGLCASIAKWLLRA